MSTRAVVKIVEKVEWRKQPYVINLYHHYDGYPEYLGVFLMEKLMEKIGNTYMLKNEFYDCDDIANKLVKCEEDNGFEITTSFHVDIEYLYTIDVYAKTLTCQEVRYKDWDSKSHRYTIIKTIDLSEYMEKNLTDMAS